MSDLLAGIEIGGTKLQLGVRAEGRTDWERLERWDVDRSRGAAGILEQLEAAGQRLRHRCPRLAAVGIGFGGPVDAGRGCVRCSHQIDGWENFPLAQWAEQLFQCRVALGNDCDLAALAEARLGAGRGASPVFYVTVGTGVGGGLVIDGELYGQDRPAVAEIGHLRPGLAHDRPEATVESLASGWGIAATAVARCSGAVAPSVTRFGSPAPTPVALRRRLEDRGEAEREFAADLTARCHGDLDSLTAKQVAEAARDGNEVAREAVGIGVSTLGWAIAQVITLLAPEVIVVGGGVSLIGESQFYRPLRKQIARYVFPPLAASYRVVAPKLGESVVVQGAIELAAQRAGS